MRDRRGDRLIGIADSERHRSVAADQRRLPGSARAEANSLSAGVRAKKGTESPQLFAACCAEREKYPAAGSRAVRARQVHPPVCHLRLDFERPLALAEQMAVEPDRLAGAGIERED